MLTAKDRELVLAQCRIQYADTPTQVEGFRRAYERAKNFALKELDTISFEIILRLEQSLAELIEPVTSKRYRFVPVRFASGDHGLDPREIPHAMHNWAAAYSDGMLSPLELYCEYERIHPRLDGNGRAGDLLWKIAITRESGSWPEELAPNVFDGSCLIAQKYRSIFGEVET